MPYLSPKIKVDLKEIDGIDQIRFLQSIVFFCSDVLEPYDDLYNMAIFRFDDSINSSGLFFAADENMYFVVSPKNILQNTEHGIFFPDFAKSLLFVVLHEIGHGLQLLKTCRRTGQCLTKCDEASNDNIRQLKSEIKQDKPEITEIDLSRLIPDEILADRFAFKNLAYMVNLYDFIGYAI